MTIIIIAGRRDDFNKLTYTIVKEKKKSDDITILQYDNLYDFSNLLIGKVTYWKYILYPKTEGKE